MVKKVTMAKKEFKPFEAGRQFTRRQKVAHMGRMVKTVAAGKGINAPALATLLGISSGGVHKMFSSPFLHSRMLLRLSAKLEYDFFAHLCQCKEPPPDTALQGARLAELEKENHLLKEKITDLKEINELLRK